MSWCGTGPLHKIEGRMDKFQYTSILENALVPYADKNLPVSWIFQQDNDPKHTAIIWIQKNGSQTTTSQFWIGPRAARI